MPDKLQKHTLHFFAGDIARLQELHPSLSVASIVRNLVRQHILNIEKATKAVDTSKIKVNVNV